MVSLTFYGGANEIGGNKILLEDKGAKIYLDFGQSFDFGEDFFYEYLQPRTANGLEVYFEFGMLPEVPKLYCENDLKFTKMKYEKPDVDAIFITHSHSDHVGHLSFLDESIPVYMGHCTHVLIDAYNKLYKQLVDIGEHSNLHEFKTGDKIKVKHLIIEPIHVEHSVPGAYGFIIHTSKGPLVYTGDFRMHGPKSDMTKEFVEKAAKCKPFAMLCEGTRMGSDIAHNCSEEEVESKITQIIKDTKGIVFANFAMSNVDRVMSFYRATVKNKRKLVIDTRFAYILDQLKGKINGLPDPRTDPNIRIYYRLKKGRKTGVPGFDMMDYEPWEREYESKKITYQELRKNGPEFVMHLGFYRLMELVYIKPKNAEYIYSQSEHFLEGEDNEDQLRVLENWLSHFKIHFTHKEVHCSGHASRQDLEKFIKTVNPKVLIPVHTQNAKDFGLIHKNVIMPEENKTIDI